ncbi:hypothetical protein IWX90DRAFT_192882 [Phyllosticta citrichinensis]|uniref:Uncharacterized protein n=1 Tax=Phyllosticta citrichinensis TaxID=1130410 RepID=A0ABR1XWY1_9PEZI
MFTRSAKPRNLENIRRPSLCLFWQTHLTLTVSMAGVLHSGLRNILWSGTRCRPRAGKKDKYLAGLFLRRRVFGTRRWWTKEGDSGARRRLWSIHMGIPAYGKWLFSGANITKQPSEPKHPFLSHDRTGCRRDTFSVTTPPRDFRPRRIPLSGCHQNTAICESLLPSSPLASPAEPTSPMAK